MGIIYGGKYLTTGVNVMERNKLPRTETSSSKKKMLVPIGGSRANILYACQFTEVDEVKFLLTNSIVEKLGEKLIQRLILNVTRITGRGKTISIDKIEGPEKGVSECRNSIVNWVKKNPDFAPDYIFSTGSTLLIQTTLAYNFPKSKMLGLRNHEIVDLESGRLVHEIQPLDIDEYLLVHGIEISEKRKLMFNGVELFVPKIHSYSMNGTVARITWTYTGRNNRKRKKIAQSIGSAIGDMISKIGVGGVKFRVFGFSPFIENSCDSRIVSCTPIYEDFKELGFPRDIQLRVPTKDIVHQNKERAIVNLNGFLGEVAINQGIELTDGLHVSATDKVSEDGRLILLTSEGKVE